MDPSLSIAKLVPDPAKCGVINYVCITEIELVHYQRWWLSVLLTSLLGALLYLWIDAVKFESRGPVCTYYI